MEKKQKVSDAKRLKAQQELLEKRNKESTRARALQQWDERKEREESAVKPVSHVTPWKSGFAAGKGTSRDEKLMADIKYKKTKSQQRSHIPSHDNVSQVEIVR